MNDVTVLITACGNVYMPGTTQALRENGERHIRLIGADMNQDDTILQMVDKYYQVPRGDDPCYVDSIYDICRNEKVEVVIPIMSVELEALSNAQDRFAQIGTTISVSDIEPLRIANDKLAFFEYLKAHDLSAPKFTAVRSIEDIDRAIGEIGLPIVFKTAQGSGSRGMRIIDPSKSRYDILFHEKPTSVYTTLEDFKATLAEGSIPEMLAMEYLSGSEYTVDMLLDEGRTLYSLCRRGLNVQSSIILDGVVEDKPEITQLCSAIAESLGLTGNIGFDVRERADGTPVIMECNPRATAGVAEFAASGVNLLYLNIKRCIGEEVPVITPKYGVIMKRRYIEMYSEK